jgi:hypothetical protein
MNNIEEKIKEIIWNHSIKILFTAGFILGFIIKSIF